ncbi:dihydrofolate reductase family protein [Sinorhizobium psoraleae]|uniref:Dihydrofolate reductase family protein n=1 Tax=Sinorhizobium psoraleae TaxID=520838 RepID=A0ABT4KEL9_9HYPH|nr:dihydrofolate reductase family protein [Sinorhizobium psoraleae]MCZ4090411.1 dihydrofolate reductase family protein [Sinorhizobium psoraleae]
MGKVIVWNLVTLDGYFEGTKKWDLDFHNRAWGPELEALSLEFGAKAQALVFGRVTYEGMAAYWPTAEGEGRVKTYMNALPKIVASRTMEKADWNNSRVVRDATVELRRLKDESEKNLYIFGSADLVASLLPENVVDEIMLCLVPVQLGDGTRFFKKAEEARPFSLLEARPLSNGGVILRYAPEAA